MRQGGAEGRLDGLVVETFAILGHLPLRGFPCLARLPPFAGVSWAFALEFL